MLSSVGSTAALDIRRMSMTRFVLFTIGAISASVALLILSASIVDFSVLTRENDLAFPVFFQTFAVMAIAGALGVEVGLKVFGRKARHGPALAAGTVVGTVVFLAMLVGGRLAAGDSEPQLIVVLASFWVSFCLALLFR